MNSACGGFATHFNQINYTVCSVIKRLLNRQDFKLILLKCHVVVFGRFRYSLYVYKAMFNRNLTRSSRKN
jgi:hypothetical protein